MSFKKKIIIAVSTIIVIIIAMSSLLIYGNNNKPHATQNAVTKSHRASPEKKADSIILPSTASSSTSVVTGPNTADSQDENHSHVNAGWRIEKQKELSTFMQSWQSQMNQKFDGTYDNKTPDLYGVKFPEALTSGKYNNHIKFDNMNVTPTWSPDGSGDAPIKVVAAAAGNVGAQGTFNRALYLFVIQNNQPKVYVSRTTNGDDLIFTETQNDAIKNGFEQVVNN